MVIIEAKLTPVVVARIVVAIPVLSNKTVPTLLSTDCAEMELSDTETQTRLVQE